MQRFWQVIGACAAAAGLVACGGGDDVGDSHSDDTAFVNGSYAVCEPDDALLASTRTILDIGPTGMAVTHRVYAGSKTCGGLLAAEVVFPLTQLTDAGTKVVAGPNSGTVRARKVIFSSEAESIQATIDSGIDHEVVDGELIVHDPNSTGVLYRVKVLQDAEPPYGELLVRYNGALYFGGDALDSENFPAAIDYSFGWAQF